MVKFCKFGQVGYDTINSSNDQILKQDMPPALKRVEESSLFLLDASQMLKADPYSGPARKKLIEGSRGELAISVCRGSICNDPNDLISNWLSDARVTSPTLLPVGRHFVVPHASLIVIKPK